MRTTEQSSRYDHLEKMSTREILTAINAEDRTVPVAVARAMDKIEALVDGIVERMRRGGRVFYLGAGTSGRLGIVDASEIPPTYGVHDKFIGLIAGGDRAIRNAVEAAEDKREGGWADMQPFQPLALSACAAERSVTDPVLPSVRLHMGIIDDLVGICADCTVSVIVKIGTDGPGF